MCSKINSILTLYVDRLSFLPYSIYLELCVHGHHIIPLLLIVKLGKSHGCQSCSAGRRFYVAVSCIPWYYHMIYFFFFLIFNLTYSRWTSSSPSCLWSQRIFPSLPGSRLTFFFRDASSALLQLVNQWLKFTYSRSHAFRYERKNTNPTLVRIELTTSALAGVQVTY